MTPLKLEKTQQANGAERRTRGEHSGLAAPLAQPRAAQPPSAGSLGMRRGGR